jgi:hypothetical protein
MAMDSDITIRDAIWHPAAEKALEIPGIPNRFLRAVSAEIGETFREVFQVCLDRGYHLKKFREANTVILKKPKKVDLEDVDPDVLRPGISKSWWGCQLEMCGVLMDEVYSQSMERQRRGIDDFHAPIWKVATILKHLATRTVL